MAGGKDGIGAVLTVDGTEVFEFIPRTLGCIRYLAQVVHRIGAANLMKYAPWDSNPEPSD